MALIFAMCIMVNERAPCPKIELRRREESLELLPYDMHWSVIEHSADKLFTAASDTPHVNL